MRVKCIGLRGLYPENLYIELSAEAQEKAWHVCAGQPYSNAAARWNAYLNCLCLKTFLTCFKEISDLQETLDVWPLEAELPSFWEVVNGTALTLGATRLVLIPSDKSNLPEFRIPQEWVDIPEWATNYYLAVQLNLVEGWLRVWGYATRQQIEEEARYDPMDRTYSLDREDLIEDLNVMWVAHELCLPKKPEVKPLPSLSRAQAEELLAQLSGWTPDSPRLDVPFEEWAALVASDSCRQHLYRLRLENQKSSELSILSSELQENDLTQNSEPKNQDSLSVAPVKRHQPVKNNLSLWFQNIFEAGWRPVDELLSPEQRNLAFQFSSDSVLIEIPVQGAKLIDLRMQLGGTAVVLLIVLTPKVERKISICVQLHAASAETYLPPNLRLSSLSQSGANLQEVTSRSHDKYIQLKRFESAFGKSFGIQVTLGDVMIKKDFVLQPLAADSQE